MLRIYFYRIKEVCIKLVTLKCLYYYARSEKHQIRIFFVWDIFYFKKRPVYVLLD